MEKKPIYKKAWFWIIIIVVVIAVGGSSSNNTNTLSTNGEEVQAKESKITLEKFNQIKTGMTYEEVVEIIGEEGTVMSDVDIGSEEYKTTMYYWYGKDGISNANITIQGGKVVSKAQLGLE